MLSVLPTRLFPGPGVDIGPEEGEAELTVDISNRLPPPCLAVRLGSLPSA